MNLRNIYDLFDMSDEGISTYCQSIGINNEEATNAFIECIHEVAAIRDLADIVPLSNRAFGILMLALNHNRVNNGGLGTIPIDRTISTFSWCSENYIPVKIGGHYLLLWLEQYSDFNRVLDLWENGEFDSADELMYCYAREDTVISDEAHDYFIRIGILSPDPMVIPENSESLSVKESTSRFSTAMWYEAIQSKVVILAGVGGIGSYVGFLISRFHPRAMFIYDDDKVESANMSGQLYGKTDIGKFKVDALSGMVNNYADFGSVFAVSQRFTEESEPSDIMICGFDNMEARNLFFNKWRKMVENKPAEERCHCLFIDGRLAAEELQVLCITGDNSDAIREYANRYLFSDEEADETICSYKQTTYMANMIGSVISNLFVNFVANDLVGAPIRELPFLTQYSGITMQFKIE